MRSVHSEAEVEEPEGTADPGRPSLVSRIVWGMVFFLAAAVLLGILTLASVAMLSPDAFEGACKRPQLVRPEACSPVGKFGG